MLTTKLTDSIEKKWHVIDASGQTLGRLSSRLAHILQGKHKAYYVPYLDCGDHVVVTNASKIKMTGNKVENKSYYNYSGYIGGMKERTAKNILATKPEALIEIAVKGMLPKNKLADRMILKLKVYGGAEHPHAAQNPVALT